MLAARAASELTAHGVHLTGDGRGAPSLRCGPSGDTPSVPPLKQQIGALRPGLDGGVPAVHDNAEKRDGGRFGDRRWLIAPTATSGPGAGGGRPLGGASVLSGPRASSRLAEAVANARGFLVSWACTTTTREEESPMRLTTLLRRLLGVTQMYVKQVEMAADGPLTAGGPAGKGRARAADPVRRARHPRRPRAAAASGRPRRRAGLPGTLPAGPQRAGGHAGRNRLARRRQAPLAVDVRHPGDHPVYAICPGRSFDDAATLLGTDYSGVLVRDGWVVYRCYKGLHQSCINHLANRCRKLREGHPRSPWGPAVLAVLRAGLAARDRCNAGEMSEHGLASVRGRLEARLGRLIDAPPRIPDAQRFANHLATEFPAVFLFLRDPSIDATNWRAEQAIRPAVVIRKVCGGNRTRQGADTQQVLSSVVRTARQRGLDLPRLITEMLRAREPVVPEAFGLPPPPA